MTSAATVASLFVHRHSVYWGRSDVDAWDEKRDARRYEGTIPVVAHPPCARWCRLAKLVESISRSRSSETECAYNGETPPILAVGDDHGCFASALSAVRRYGGVLEHPAWSIAWAAHGLTAPPARGWNRDIDGGWCCEVSQAAYGHRARKLTWLYYVGRNPPTALDWSRPTASGVVSGLRNNCGRPLAARVWGREASATPPAFAEALLGLARACGGAP
jgi:hypothetical protein